MRRFISEDPLRFAAGDVNFYAYVSNNPINFTAPLGLEVAVCKRDAQLPIIGSLGGFIKHWWLKTDTKEAGMAEANGSVAGDQIDLPYVTPVIISDHSDYERDSCTVIPNIDEECVNAALEIGKNLGSFSLGNNCSKPVVEILNKCKTTDKDLLYNFGGSSIDE